MPEKDITQTGPVGMKGLSAVDQRKANEDRFRELSPDEMLSALGKPKTPSQVHQEVTRNLGEFTPMSSGEDIGSSIYDKNIYELSEVERAGDIRAENQPGIAQFAAGFAKMDTTAVTTFLDGTLGSMIGLIQGTFNALDGDPETSFREGLWNNSFNKAMASAQEKMEEILPNYYTEEQQNSPWYSAANLLSANFWGDKFLKNMGFTIGAMATMAIPGLDASWAAKGISGVGRALKLGDTAIKRFDKAGKVAQRVVNTLISASGEAAIEAVNAANDNFSVEMGNHESQKRQALQEAQQWYAQHQFDPYTEGTLGGNNPREIYLNRLQEIENEYSIAKDEIEKGIRNVGNSVYAANIAVLSLTNNLEFGKYLKGGYNLQKGFLGFDMITKEGKTESLREFGKALAKGEGKLAIGEEVGKVSAGKVIVGSIARAIEEGSEEGLQRLASDTEQMREQARINTWAKGQEDSFYVKGINPDVTDDLVDRFKAIHQAWNTSFGDISSTGWEEVLLGALTGGIGTFNIKQNRNGKVKFGWQGGVYEEIASAKERREDAEKYVKAFNDRVNNKEFRERITHAITAMSLTEDMDRFLRMDDTLRYKNAELAAVVNDALYFKSAGALDTFKSFYEEMANGVSDEDVEIVKTQLKKLNGKSPYDQMTSDEIKQTLQDKAKSTLEKVDTALSLHDHHTLVYGNDAMRAANEVADDTFPGGAENLAEAALREMTAKASLISDLERRKTELQDRIDNMDDVTKAIRGTAREEKAIRDIDKSLAKNKEEYANMKDDISDIEKQIQRNYHLAERRRLAKDSATFKTALKEATTIQEVADLYFSSEDQYRKNIYEEAIEEADDAHKPVLEAFKPFLASVNALNDIVDGIAVKQFPLQDDADEATVDAIEFNRGMLEANLGDLLNYVIDGYVTDTESGSFGKEDLETAIRNLAQTLRESPVNSDKERESNQYYSEKLDTIADELAKIDVVYKAAEPRPTQESEQQEEQEEPDDGTEVQEENDEKGPDIHVKGTYHSEEETPEEEAPVEDPETTIVNDRINAEKYANRYLKKALGDDFDKFINIIGQDDPSQEDRDWVAEKVKDKRFNNFVAKYLREAQPAPAPSASPASSVGETEIAKDETEIPVARESTPEDDNKSREEADKSGVSMRANPFRPYLMGVKDHTGIIQGIRNEAIRNAENPSYYENWYALPFAKGIDYIVNNHLWKLMKAVGQEGKLKVNYAKYYPNGIQATGVNKPHIMLVIPYTDAVKKILPPSTPAIQGNIINNGENLVVGAVGYSTGNKALAEAQDAISEAIEKQRGIEGISEWEILKEGENGEWVNYIYDVSPGYVIRKNTEEDTGDVSLETLLNSDNETGQDLNDLRFSIWYGSEDSRNGVRRELVTIRKGDQLYEDAPHEPGQVVVWIPTADGAFIPQYVSPLVYNEINEENNGEVYRDIQAEIDRIAKNKDNPKEVEKGLARLRGNSEVPGLVITSHKENQGNQIMYDANNNTIVLQVDGLFQNDKTIYLSSATLTEEELRQRLQEMLTIINPRISVDAFTLKTNPGYYVNNGIIQVNLRKWGVVNARAFVYPPNASGQIDQKFVPSESRRQTERVETPNVEAVYFISGKKYRMVDGEIFDNRNVKVTDAEVGTQFIDILNIERSGMSPFVDDKTGSKYFIIGDRVYHKTRNASYNPLNQAQKDRVFKSVARQQAKERLANETADRIAELEKSIAEIQRIKSRLKKSDYRKSDPQTLTEVVAYALAAIKKPLNWDNILSEVGSNHKDELKKLLSGGSRLASASSHYMVDNLVSDIIGDNPIGLTEDDSQDIRNEIIELLLSGMTRRQLRDIVAENRLKEESGALDYQLDELERELDRLKSSAEAPKPVAQPAQPAQPASAVEPAPQIEDMPDFEEAPEPEPVKGKISLTDLQEQREDTNFVSVFMDYVESGDYEDRLIDAVENALGTDPYKYEERVQDSDQRDLFYAVHDRESLIAFMEEVKKCGI